jgi:hypothetical protein
MANGTAIVQQYIDWLAGLLQSAYQSGDTLGLGDPSKSGGGWFSGPSKAYSLMEDVINRLNAGTSIEQMPWFSIPPMSGVDSFVETYKNYYAQEDKSWLEGGQLVAGGQILRTKDGRYVDPSTGIEYDLQTALTMIQNWLGTKDDDSLTKAEEASLDLALKELAWEKEKFGTLSAADKAQLQLAYDQLQQTRNEWLANLQANPADWIEKWYAEHLPTGSQLGQTYPWGEPVVGTDAWAQKVGINGGAATPTTTGGSWSPPNVTQPTIRGGNPWTTPQGGVNQQAINNWTGGSGKLTTLGGSYGNMPSYQEYMKAYPNSSITPEGYYSEMGAYELAAQYNPAYAYGAQQAKIALQTGDITPTQYQQIKDMNFVDAQGNPLAPQTRAQLSSQQVAQGWAQMESPQGYVAMLQAQGITPDSWAKTFSPQASQQVKDYTSQYANYLMTTNPNSPNWNWSGYDLGATYGQASLPGASIYDAPISW